MTFPSRCGRSRSALLGVIVLAALGLAGCGRTGVTVPEQRAELRAVEASYRATLPPLLETEAGAPVATRADWFGARRPELRNLVQMHEYGFLPPPPARMQVEVLLDDPAFMGGAATLKLVRLMIGPPEAPAIDLLLVAPNDVDAPSPVILGLNFMGNHSTLADPRIPLSTQWIPERGEGVVDNRATEASRGTSAGRWPFEQAVERGYAIATFYHGDVDPDRDDFTDGVHPHIALDGATQRTAHSWGSLAAWAWGMHRAVDYLTGEPLVDAERIAVMGHSRNGKAALLAAALDDRIALTISNQSGCGGAALSRRKVGETVAAINTRFPHWFNLQFRAYNDNEDAMPIDQHSLLALIAPRPLLVASAEDDAWADPEGEFLSLVEVSPVYALLGAGGLSDTRMPAVNRLVRGTLGYHIRPGGHGVGAEDWSVFMDFADDHFKR